MDPGLRLVGRTVNCEGTPADSTCRSMGAEGLPEASKRRSAGCDMSRNAGSTVLLGNRAAVSGSLTASGAAAVAAAVTGARLVRA